MNLDNPEADYHPFDLMTKSIAKTPSIKTGTYLSQKEQEALVDDLFSCQEPSIAPDGKPTFKILNINEIDQLFKAKLC